MVYSWKPHHRTDGNKEDCVSTVECCITQGLLSAQKNECQEIAFLTIQCQKKRDMALNFYIIYTTYISL